MESGNPTCRIHSRALQLALERENINLFRTQPALRSPTSLHGRPSEPMRRHEEIQPARPWKRRWWPRKLPDVGGGVLDFRARAFIEGVGLSHRWVGECDWLLLKSTNQFLCLPHGIEAFALCILCSVLVVAVAVATDVRTHARNSNLTILRRQIAPAVTARRRETSP